MTVPQPPQDTPQGSAPFRRGNLIWWLVFIVLLVWNLMAFWPAGQAEVDVPYTTFLAQVRAGNVAEVRIQGDEITGSFLNPFQWPQPTPSPAATPVQQVTPTTPATYTKFLTTLPQAVGDPSLLPLLEAHHVMVDVSPPSTPWFTILLTDGLPLLLMLLFFVMIGRQAAQSQAGVFGFGRSKARRYVGDRPSATFYDVAGADEARTELREVVDFLVEAEH